MKPFAVSFVVATLVNIYLDQREIGRRPGLPWPAAVAYIAISAAALTGAVFLILTYR